MKAGISKPKSDKKRGDSESLYKYANLLGLTKKETEYLDITDQSGSLIMLHHKSGVNIINPKVATVRGLVIDTKRNYIVCPGNSFPVPIISDKLEVNESNRLILEDNFGVTHTFDMTKTEITPFYDVVHFKCFLHNGVRYLTTNKKFDPRADNSRWYDLSTPFATMYDEGGGPSPDDLFPKDAKESPYVYEFSVVHPVLNVCNLSLGLEDRYVRFDSISSMWNLDNSPFNSDEIGVVNQEPVDLNSWEGVLKNTIMSIDEANYFLKNGNHHVFNAPDPRLGLGESVFLTEYDDDKKIIQTVHVISTARKYRDDLFTRDSNFYQTFVMREGISRYNMKFPKDQMMFLTAQPMIDPMMSLLSEGFTMRDVKLVKKKELRNMSMEQLEISVWLNFYLCISDYYKPFAYRCLQRYKYDIDNLKQWIYNLHSVSDVSMGNTRLSHIRIRDIINQAVIRANEDSKKYKGALVGASGLIMKNISYLVDRERPDSLRMMIGEMRGIKKDYNPYAITDEGRNISIEKLKLIPIRKSHPPSIAPSELKEVVATPGSPILGPVMSSNPIFGPVIGPPTVHFQAPSIIEPNISKLSSATLEGLKASPQMSLGNLSGSKIQVSWSDIVGK